MAKILLAEDDRDLSEVITLALQAKGHLVQQAYNGPECSACLTGSSYDLIILDWMMPGFSGVELCKEFRDRGGRTPILMLTAKNAIEDRERGLDSGADDYLSKPFDPRELAARVRALLRRPDNLVGEVLRAGRLEMDTSVCEVRIDGNVVVLRPKEYHLLEFFMRHPNQVFANVALMQRVWLDDSSGSVDNLKTHIKTLRRKLNDTEGRIVRTVRGRGYMLSIENTEESRSVDP